MDSLERPHRSGSSTSSELFICFTSRHSSSSSMKISSKSILSPGRPRDAPVSLSTSLSRRLRTNGSVKGGQSPMFPTGGKKRASCAFENPEPSSPKVTCIGQVRVKTKKQGKKIRTLSKRRGGGGGGEVSFRRIEQCRDGVNPNQTQQEGLTHRNQRWVHLPLTICEALRAVGAEVSCLFPCRSSCFSMASEREKEEKPPVAGAESDGNGQNSCGAVFARWFVALQDGGEGRKGRREIELVVGGDEEERTETGGEITLRRHMEEEREMKDEKCEAKEGSFDEEDAEARVSICIPPKNALLLMRCRSDPVRMSALAHRFWESPARKVEEDDEEEEEEEEEEDDEVEEDEEEGHENVDSESLKGGDTREDEEEEENPLVAVHLAMELQEAEEKENSEEMLECLNEELQEEDQEKQEPVVDQEANLVAEAAEENEVTCSFSEALSDPDNIENEDGLKSIQEKQEDEEEEKEEVEERRATHHSSSVASIDSDLEEEEVEVVARALAEEAALEEEEEVVVVVEEKSKEEKETQERTLKEEETVIVERIESEKTHAEEVMESEERERESHERLQRESKVKMKKKKQERENGSVLPDCLLLMMCEPKLSMEVSKETWVCSTDFIRWLPERAVNAINGGDDPKKRISTDSNPAQQHHRPQQPPRSSCSFPAPAALSMATMIEQKLVNAVAYEPFVLTRCKSEPMRTAAAKLAPDSCFWKNRKLEPHRRATFGIGAAGVGF